MSVLFLGAFCAPPPAIAETSAHEIYRFYLYPYGGVPKNKAKNKSMSDVVGFTRLIVSTEDIESCSWHREEGKYKVTYEKKVPVALTIGELTFDLGQDQFNKEQYLTLNDLVRENDYAKVLVYFCGSGGFPELDEIVFPNTPESR